MRRSQGSAKPSRINSSQSLKTLQRQRTWPAKLDLVISDHPYEAIINAAEEKGCDLIAMASHGRKGVQGLTLGSETQKVLTNSKIPVLVFR